MQYSTQFIMHLLKYVRWMPSIFSYSNKTEEHTLLIEFIIGYWNDSFKLIPFQLFYSKHMLHVSLSN